MTEPSATSRSPQSSPAPSYATAVTVEDFRRNLAAIRARIDAAAKRAGRDAAEIRLLPVSKTVPEERLRTAFAAGITQMGENKVQEAQRKSENLADLGISWSVIGHLQTNKAKNVAAFADEFQALDSLRLAEALDRRLQAAGRSLDVYVQVNSSGEPSKFGLLAAGARAHDPGGPHRRRGARARVLPHHAPAARCRPSGRHDR